MCWRRRDKRFGVAMTGKQIFTGNHSFNHSPRTISAFIPLLQGSSKKSSISDFLAIRTLKPDSLLGNQGISGYDMNLRPSKPAIESLT
jgi:hypothetical protein